MKRNVSACCLLLLVALHFVAGKSGLDLQNWKQLLEEENNAAPFYTSDELEERDGPSEKSLFGGSPVLPSEPENSALAEKHSILAQLFKDLARTSKRSWSRYKKGGMRSCFGVRLDRIGSFSGLGC
ncbi:natriuretic peptide A-like isoform 1-T2 [Synchiropus picturatus]